MKWGSKFRLLFEELMFKYSFLDLLIYYPVIFILGRLISLVWEMPNKKKQPKNAFYFYMLKVQDEYQRGGVNYKLSEIAEMAGPGWRVSIASCLWQKIKLWSNDTSSYVQPLKTSELNHLLCIVTCSLSYSACFPCQFYRYCGSRFMKILCNKNSYCTVNKVY